MRTKKQKRRLNHLRRQFAILNKEEISNNAKEKRAKRNTPSFYKTRRWKRLRYEVLCEQNSTCQLCGTSPNDGSIMNVDHIYPLHSHPHLAWEKTNLRVLCSSCNWGKGERSPTEFEEEFKPPWDKFDKF